MKKRLITLFLAFTVCLTMTIPAFANGNCESDSEISVSEDLSAQMNLPCTYETAMPEIPLNYGINALAEQETLMLPERKEWVKETTEILQDAYCEKVVSVYETESAVVFEFEEPNPEEFLFGENYIMKEVYMKPEASSSSANNATKISYVYGFGEGMYENGAFDVDSREGKWSTIMNMVITVAGLKKECSVAAAVLSLCGLSSDFFSATTPVKVDNLAQYYFINKVGRVQDTLTKQWVPLSYVGLRKDFRNFYVYENKNGYLLKVGEDVTVPNNFVNPTNADATYAKPHFWDDDWIMDKALSIYEQDSRRAYMDVYLLIDGFYHDEYPWA